MQLAVQTGPPRLLHIASQAGLDIEIGPRTQPFGGDLAGPSPHPVADVLAADHEVLALLIPAPHDHVTVRIVGIPVVDRDPLEARAKIALHAAHEVACESP